jgi:hypothetical protein
VSVLFLIAGDYDTNIHHMHVGIAGGIAARLGEIDFA